jgi:superfamily II DNA/RNA helicase
VYLLECLQTTAPPVLIFAENKNDVDDIHEYLLIKGVEAVAVHGGKDQEEREFAIDAFKVRSLLLAGRLLQILNYIGLFPAYNMQLF